jgi:hypothetical protein
MPPLASASYTRYRPAETLSIGAGDVSIDEGDTRAIPATPGRVPRPRASTFKERSATFSAVSRARGDAGRLALAFAIASLGGCTLLIGANGISGGIATTDGGADTGASPDASDAGELDADCLLLVSDGGDVCATIPPFVGVQTVDGVGSEFCAIPATKFVVAQGLDQVNPQNAEQVATVAYIRVGWSADAIHMDIRVEQPVVTPPPLGDPAVGDAVEVFLSPSSLLHGYTGPGYDVGAQIVCGAPAPAQPPFAEMSYFPPGAFDILDAGQFAARQIDGGYELEIELSWADLATYTQGLSLLPVAGSTIGLDFAYDVGAGDGGRLFQSTYSFHAHTGDSGCPQYDFPFCDDRTWCTPALSP